MSKKIIKIYLAPYVNKVHKKLINSNGKPYISKRYVTVPSKKNQNIPRVTKSGKPFIQRSAQYSEWKEIVEPIFRSEKEKLLNAGITTISRCKIKIVYYFPDNVARDVTNKDDSIMDALVDSGIILQDSVQVSNDVHGIGYICKHQPRTEIYIHILTPEDPDYEIDKTDYEKLRKQQSEERSNRRKWVKT